MDPVTALSVATSAVSFLDFAFSLFCDAYIVYKSSEHQLEDIKDIRSVSNRLNALTTDLQFTLDKYKMTTLSQPDLTLLKLCEECSDINLQIQNVVDKLTLKGTTRFDRVKNSFIVAAKGLLGKDKVTELRGRIDQKRMEIMTELLVSIRRNLECYGVSVARVSERLEEIHCSLNRVLGGSNRERLVEELLKRHWEPETIDGLLHPPKDPDTLISKVILKSLEFETLHAREATIPTPYKSTYEWIFTADCDRQKNWTNFSSWLRSPASQDIYWITGKAGSGKSTLMKFIMNHPSLKDELAVWSDGLPLLVSSHFFWQTRSDPLHRSLEGMMRTLLWRCLMERPDLAQTLFSWRWNGSRILGIDAFIQLEFTTDELRRAWAALVSHSGIDYRLAIFIDGLDEFGDGHEDEIIELINSTKVNSNVKICVSSRPWSKFLDAFGRGPSLEMQQLTTSDIATYVSGRFFDCQSFCELQSIFANEPVEFLREVSRRAEGVFLWVTVVTTVIIEDMVQGRIGTMAQAQAVLNTLPGEMKDLYAKVWDAISPTDKPTSCRLVRLTLAAKGVFDAETCWRAEGLALPPNITHGSKIRELLIAQMRRRLNTYTKGLLEADAGGVINFLHRTALEWVNEPTMRASIWESCPPDFNPYLQLFDAGVNTLASFQIPEPPPTIPGFINLTKYFYPYDFFEPIARCMSYASEVARSAAPGSTDTLIEALNRLDSTATEAANRNRQYLQAYVLDHPVYPAQPLPEVPRIETDSSIPPYHFRLPGTSTELGPLFTGGDQYSRFHWSKIQGRDDDGRIENCFAGLAAQFGILCYVKAAVALDPSLLQPAPYRMSLLENAVFGWTYQSLRKGIVNRLSWKETFCPPERLELVRYLLDAGQHLSYKSGVDQSKSISDLITQPSRYESRKVYYKQVLEEGRKKHGER